MIPFYIYYSMFGLQRVGDLAWLAGGVALNCVANGRLAREAGFEEHLAKPSSLEKLEELLARSPAGSLPLPRPHN